MRTCWKVWLLRYNTQEKISETPCYFISKIVEVNFISIPRSNSRELIVPSRCDQLFTPSNLPITIYESLVFSILLNNHKYLKIYFCYKHH